MAALYDALVKNDAEKVREVLRTNAVDVNQVGRIGGYNDVTPLLYAAHLKIWEICEILLQHHADVNKMRGGLTPPLVQAAVNKNVQMMKLFVEHGADVNISSDLNDHYNGYTALHYASQNSHVEAVEFLLTCKDLDVMKKNMHNQTAYDLANNGLIKTMLKIRMNECESKNLCDMLLKLKRKLFEDKLATEKQKATKLSNKVEKLFGEISQKSNELEAVKHDFAIVTANICALQQTLVEFDRKEPNDEAKTYVIKESSLECTYCLEVPEAPKRVYQCTNGHIYCSVCAENQNMRVCPQCRVPLDQRIRCLRLEQLIEEKN